MRFMQFPTATVVFALAALAVALTAFVATRDNDANAAEVAEPTSGPEMYSIPATFLHSGVSQHCLATDAAR